MNNGPKISIITACYNAENTIEQTIQSVLGQTYKNIEYIIIDGASTDGTMEIVEKYRDKVDVVVSESDKGVYDAFNKGIGLATGDFINFMNADDYFKDILVVEKIARILNEKKPKILYGKVRAIDEISGEWQFRGKLLTLNDFKKGEMCPHQGVFTERNIFSQFGGFNLKYKILSDVDFTIKCFKKYEFETLFVNEEIAIFRIGGLSTNIKYMNRFHEENKEIHLEHFNYIPIHSKKYLDNKDIHISNYHYRELFMLSILDNDSLLKGLKKSNRSAAIFGSRRLAVLLYHYLNKNGFKISGFIDNNKEMQGEYLLGKEIVSADNVDLLQVDIIIVSVERFVGANEVKLQLEKLNPKIKIITWHELIDSTSNL
ncbi:glycosyltransferase family 2 protein [Lysinibacillus fusiformis]|uniref:Glycosyltransferase 2-like domain-containing protein n=1 Tax=Lysinibacillus fusiformis TaxID=28031 RepID=A0A1E4R332_9BACI|nr:glycosyltransferase family 2 protein [Lysinibacillus fusiformis]ODV54865.1 hypothetical protein BG258_02655 [Lysinibacillus fusiformis]